MSFELRKSDGTELELSNETNFEENFKKLVELIEKKISTKHSLITVVINGLPNSGKTHLRKKIQTHFNGYEEDQLISRAAIGFDGVENVISKLPKKLLVVEDVTTLQAAKSQAKRLGLNVDIYVYIYNPKFKDGVSESEKSKADLIIENPDSKLK